MLAPSSGEGQFWQAAPVEFLHQEAGVVNFSCCHPVGIFFRSAKSGSWNSQRKST